MESVLTATERQSMVSYFLEIAIGQSAETARQFLQATSWNLEEAIQLFYNIGNEGGSLGASSNSQNNLENANGQAYSTSEEVVVRPPLPVKREALYDDATLYTGYRNFDEEMNRPGIWASNNSQNNLDSLYRPPSGLMHHGPFEQAKQSACVHDKWLLVNVQSTTEFSSHMLNRDTWSNEAVAQTISSNFIFWQAYDDTTEGMKVCTYYKLDLIPAVLVIDPITGQKMRSWNGMIQPESLLEDLLLLFMDCGPKEHHKRPRESSTSDHEICVSSKKPKHIYPPLPEEPKRVEMKHICRVGIRLPDGRRCQRSFLRTDPVQLLWSFCSSQLDEEAKARSFLLTEAIPGASKPLDYESVLSFEESGLANTLVTVTWDE